jgi:hypothetical protein
MMFSMANKTSFQLTFIAQVKIQIQESSSKEKKEKETLMMFPIGKNTPFQPYLHSTS